MSTRKNVIYGMIDGRGSGYRGDKFLHEVYHRLGSVEVEDQLEVTRFVSQNLVDDSLDSCITHYLLIPRLKLSCILDISLQLFRYLKDNLHYIHKDKVSIWGWSYGGYVTAMSLASDTVKTPVFSCGISVAPVTDWLLYGKSKEFVTKKVQDIISSLFYLVDSAYTERYMSSPQKNWRNYVKASVLNKVLNLKGKKYLLVHGTADGEFSFFFSFLPSFVRVSREKVSHIPLSTLSLYLP